MTRDAKRVNFDAQTDLRSIIRQVSEDREPRVLESEGVPVAAVVTIDDLDYILGSSAGSDGIARAMRSAGAWKELKADDLGRRVYEARHESPPSPRIDL
jgi:hypothetical protein